MPTATSLVVGVAPASWTAKISSLLALVVSVTLSTDCAATAQEAGSELWAATSEFAVLAAAVAVLVWIQFEALLVTDPLREARISFWWQVSLVLAFQALLRFSYSLTTRCGPLLFWLEPAAGGLPSIPYTLAKIQRIAERSQDHGNR